jgi:phenylalanyl-tRNA synthetase beta subunit
MAEEDEKLVLLDGQEVSLRADTLVIADHERALAIAGVMGGEHSGVAAGTRDLFLESAFFDTIAAPTVCTPTPRTASNVASTGSWPAKPWSVPPRCCWRSSAESPVPSSR